MKVLRHKRLRKRVGGTAARPRLAVFRSSRHISAQIIDDAARVTLVGVSTQQAAVAEATKDKKPVEAAAAVGAELGQRALAAGVKCVVFDRGGYKYHGRVKALADAAREAGLEF
jgi:large subunit ribosomal protein L18